MRSWNGTGSTPHELGITGDAGEAETLAGNERSFDRLSKFRPAATVPTGTAGRFAHLIDLHIERRGDVLVGLGTGYDVLRRLGAPERLLKHVQLVGEAADNLVAAHRGLGLGFDPRPLGCECGPMPAQFCAV